LTPTRSSNGNKRKNKNKKPIVVWKNKNTPRSVAKWRRTIKAWEPLLHRLQHRLPRKQQLSSVTCETWKKPCLSETFNHANQSAEFVDMTRAAVMTKTSASLRLVERVRDALVLVVDEVMHEAIHEPKQEPKHEHEPRPETMTEIVLDDMILDERMDKTATFSVATTAARAETNAKTVTSAVLAWDARMDGVTAFLALIRFLVASNGIRVGWMTIVALDVSDGDELLEYSLPCFDI
jgi:hypothetical protein